MNLFLCTGKYPFGLGEAFVENELRVLEFYFDNIYVIPMATPGRYRSSFDFSKVTLLKLEEVESNGRMSFLLTLRILLAELRENRLSLRNVRYQVRILRNAFRRQIAFRLITEGLLNADDVIYAYWMEEWANTLALEKLEGRIRHFVCRAHRFDLYDEENSNGFIALRSLQMSQVDDVYCISEDGLKYLHNKFPKYSHKLSLSRLGTFDFGINEIVPSQETINVVSCSSVKLIKRVELIAEAVSMMPNVHWTHLGGGQDFERLDRLCKVLTKNHSKLRIDLKGMVTNEQVHEFLRTRPIHVFVNVSASEGLPVSIMEAISYGLPVVATDVGGTREIVGDITGRLLDANVEPLMVARAIIETATKFASPKSRDEIRMFWASKFNAQSNYQRFAKSLQTLVSR